MKEATGHFSTENELGRGGFGVVYRGKLQNGEEVAIKKLSKKSRQGIQEFSTEVDVLAKLQHRNLVRLVGYCADKDKTLLVYEYVPNLSLDKHLFEANESNHLDWGTSGYMAPKYARGGRFSFQSDAYSFGVILLEIVAGQSIHKRNQSYEDEGLLYRAWRLWEEGVGEELLDPTLRNGASRNEVLRCIQLALLCVQDEANNRPSMQMVLLSLNSNSVDIPQPVPPAAMAYEALSNSTVNPPRDWNQQSQAGM